MSLPLRSFTLPVVLCGTIALFAGVRSASAQISWDGGSNANASGNWSLASNWTDDLLPSAGPVVLGDVTSGTRFVTFDSANPSITSLTMEQFTAGGVNALQVAGPSVVLTLTGSGASVLSQTLTAGQLLVNVNGGAAIELSATTAKSFNNSGILNLGSPDLGAGILRTTGTGGGLTVSNTGVINLNEGSITRAGSTSSNNNLPMIINNGSASNATAEMRFQSGTNLLGAPNIPSNGTVNTLNNFGLTVFENGSLTNLASAASSGGTSGFAFNNKAGGTVRIGRDTVAGAAVVARTGTSGSFFNFVLNNEGTLGVYGQSRLVNRSSSGGNPDGFRIENSGIMNLAGDATGVTLGYDSGTNSPTAAQFNNSGTVNVKVFNGEASGRVVYGTIGTGGSQRASANLTNNGSFNVAPDAAFLMQGRGGPTNQNVVFTNGSGGSLTLGTSGETSGGGGLQFNMTQYGGTPTGTAVGPTFTNNGTATLYGTSRIELLAGSASAADGNKFNVTNVEGANLNLHDSAGIGNSSKRVSLVNSGTITKLGGGVSGIVGASGSTYTSSGTVDVRAGSLIMGGALDNTGVLKGAGVLGTGGYMGNTGSSVEPGNNGIGALTLALNSFNDTVTFASGAEFRFDLAAPGSSDMLAFTGLGTGASSVNFSSSVIHFSSAGGLAPGLYTLFSFDQSNAYSGTLNIGSGLEAFGGSSLIYAADSIQLNVAVVPEPSTGITAALLAMGLLMRRPRRKNGVLR